MATGAEEKEPETSASESTFDYCCLPCSEDGQHVEAVGFCVDCEEHLCQRCYQGHTIARAMRQHVLLDREKILKQKPASVTKKDKSTEKCSQHDEIINYFCLGHSALGCSVCVTLQHRSCDDIKFIPEVSNDIRNNAEFKTFQTKLTAIEHDSTYYIDQVQEKIKLVEQCHRRTLQAVEQIRKEVNDALDRIVEEIHAEAGKIKKEETAKMTSVNEKSNALLQKIGVITRQIDDLLAKNQKCNTFIKMKKTDTVLEELKRDLTSMKHDSDIRQFTFKPNTELAEFLNQPYPLGKLCLRNYTSKHVTDITVKSEGDNTLPWITGATSMPDNKLVVTDHYNHKVKVIDTAQNKMVSEITLEYGPWALTKVSDNQLAVTLSSSQMLAILNTDPTLAVDRYISVSGACRGIAHHEGRFIVTFDKPHKVQILDTTGNVLQTLTTDSNGQPLFNMPWYVAISPDNQSMYVSNFMNAKVVRLQLDGSVMATYRVTELIGPCQMTCDDNDMIFVCGRLSHNIHMLSTSCKKVKELLTKEDGIKFLNSISYDDHTDRLYVGMDDSEYIKVFQLS